ncbi:MAG: fibronectin type III domain-containing protein, partial [Bacteroidota bacterium]
GIITLASIYSYAQKDFKLITSDYSSARISFINDSEGTLTAVLRHRPTAERPPLSEMAYEAETNLKNSGIRSVTGENNFIIYNSKKEIDNSKKENAELSIKGLQPGKEYFIAFYKKEDGEYVKTIEKLIHTKAIVPRLQARDIGIMDNEDGTRVSFIRGSGTFALLLLAEGDKITYPEDSKTYRTGNYGMKDARIGNSKTYAIDIIKDGKNSFDFKGLEPDKKYTVAIVEASGEGKSVVYNKKSSNLNPRSFYSTISAPVITGTSEITEESITIRWDKVGGADTYLLQVSKDKDFKKAYSYYNSIDIGDIEEYPVSGLEQGETYYIRLKAKKGIKESSWSRPVKASTDIGKGR